MELIDWCLAEETGSTSAWMIEVVDNWRVLTLSIRRVKVGLVLESDETLIGFNHLMLILEVLKSSTCC